MKWDKRARHFKEIDEKRRELG